MTATRSGSNSDSSRRPRRGGGVTAVGMQPHKRTAIDIAIALTLIFQPGVG